MRGDAIEAMRGIQHGGIRMAKTLEDGGSKADDRGQGMTRLIAAPRPTRFDLKKRKQTDRNEHIRFAGSKVRYGTMIKFYRGL